MNIWVDICHIPQYKFYRPLMIELAKRGHEVYVTVLGRGRTPQIMQHELAGTSIHVDVVGRHRMTKWSAIWDANIIRTFQLLRWARKKKIDIGFSNGVLLAFVCKLKGIRNYSFDDDPQTLDRKGKEWWNTECNF